MTGGWQAALYLHVIAMAFFLGGQLVFAAAVVPAIVWLGVDLSG